MDLICNYVCLNVAKDTNKTVHLAHFLSATDASTPGLSNITGILVCQTNIMGTVSTLATFQNFVLPVHKMNKSSLAFTGKLNRKQFSANLTINWSSAVCLKLTIGKRFNLVCTGAIEAVSAM